MVLSLQYSMLLQFTVVGLVTSYALHRQLPDDMLTMGYYGQRLGFLIARYITAPTTDYIFPPLQDNYRTNDNYIMLLRKFFSVFDAP